MRIAYITAGAAGMYCGSCMHDNTLVRALQNRGVDIVLVPTYTPVRTDEVDVSMHRIFMGGINVYLQQKSAFFRHTPWFIDKLFEWPALLKWVSRLSSSTKAEDLGDLVLSVLQGEEGNQKKELLKLVAWLKERFRPDLVQLTNSMFAGFARLLKRELGVPVLCSLQGEDLFMDAMVPPYREQARAVLRERAGEVDGFVVNSMYYRDFMCEYLQAPPEKMHVVPLGLSLEDYGHEMRDPHSNPFTIGYLARICPEKGAHLLLEAFRRLARSVGSDHVKLKIAGYLSAGDEAYLEDLKEKARAWGLADRISFLGEVDRTGKVHFLNGLDAFSVPAPYREPKGLYVLEAMASGVPVVQPRHGAFTEMINHTGGGLLVTPDSPRNLAEGLQRLYEDRALRQELGRRGKEVVHGQYTDRYMAEKTLAVYHQFL